MRKKMPFENCQLKVGARIQLGVPEQMRFGRSGAWLDFS
jgi:hypothetical protein